MAFLAPSVGRRLFILAPPPPRLPPAPTRSDDVPSYYDIIRRPMWFNCIRASISSDAGYTLQMA